MISFIMSALREWQFILNMIFLNTGLKGGWMQERASKGEKKTAF